MYKLSDWDKTETVNQAPTYLWFHGGGFLFGSLGTEDAHCIRLVRHLHVVVVSVNYRHTPEYVWPIQREDTCAATEWVFQNLDLLGRDVTRVIVAGASAGSLLAAAVVIQDIYTVSV